MTMATAMAAWVTGSVLTSNTNFMPEGAEHCLLTKSEMGGTTPMMALMTHGGKKGVQKQSAARSDLPNLLKGS